MGPAYVHLEKNRLHWYCYVHLYLFLLLGKMEGALSPSFQIIHQKKSLPICSRFMLIYQAKFRKNIKTRTLKLMKLNYSSSPCSLSLELFGLNFYLKVIYVHNKRRRISWCRIRLFAIFRCCFGLPHLAYIIQIKTNNTTKSWPQLIHNWINRFAWNCNY